MDIFASRMGRVKFDANRSKQLLKTGTNLPEIALSDSCRVKDKFNP